MPDAKMFNERKSTLCVTPKGRSVRLNRVDNDRSYRVVNRLKVVNRSCKSGYSWPKVTITRQMLINAQRYFYLESSQRGVERERYVKLLVCLIEQWRFSRYPYL